MRALTVFFSWQTDSLPKTNRNFIGDCLRRAAKKTSLPFRVDEATRGLSGSPGIPDAIASKIRCCTIFVPDLTLVGEYSEGRFTVNPNVLVEYGFALETVGEDSIVPVFNSAYGDLKNLPFDLDKRLVRAQFDLEIDSRSKAISTESKKVARESLVTVLVRELEAVLAKGLFAGLSPSSIQILEALVTSSDTGVLQMPKQSFADLCSDHGLDPIPARQAVEALQSRNLVSVISGLDIPIHVVRPNDEMFWSFDRLYMGWHPPEDACEVAQALVNGPHQMRNQFSFQQLLAELGWSTRRLNPALTYLSKNEIVDVSDEVSYPEAYRSIIETRHTRRFLDERHD